jgi:hypothetical protein
MMMGHSDAKLELRNGSKTTSAISVPCWVFSLRIQRNFLTTNH